jgi:Tol biopolymer transport system component
LPVQRLSPDRRSPVFVTVGDLDQWWSSKRAEIESGETESGETEQSSKPVLAPAPITPPVPESTQPSIPRPSIWGKIALFLIASLILLFLFLILPAKKYADAPQIVEARQITFLPGHESGTPSPDGTRLALITNPPGGPSRLNEFVLATNKVRPLTDGSRPPHYPAWSPDGGRIAYVLYASGSTKGEIRIVDVKTGDDQRFAEFFHTSYASSVSWMPDGRTLVTTDLDSNRGGFRLLALTEHSQQRRWLSEPPATSYGDFLPIVAPDGRAVAFQRFAGHSETETDVFVQPLDRSGAPSGPPYRLTEKGLLIRGMSASRDSRWLVLAASPRNDYRTLWLIGKPWSPDAGDHAWFRLGGVPGVPESLRFFTDGRLLYTARQPNFQHIYLITPESSKDLVGPVCPSSRDDAQPDLRADGAITYLINYLNIAVCFSPAHESKQITNFSDGRAAFPRWSPGGERIAFCYYSGDDWELRLLAISQPERIRRLTSLGSTASPPLWSSDGRYIYVIKSGGLWKIPVADDEKPRVIIDARLRQVLRDPVSGTLYVLKSGDRTLYRVSAPNELIPVLRDTALDRQAIWGGWLYRSDPRTHPSREVLTRTRIPPSLQEVTSEIVGQSLPGMYNTEAGLIAVHPDGSRIAWTLVSADEGDVWEARLRFP